MFNLKRISHVSVFLLFIFVAKSVLSLFLRTSIASNFGAGTETDAYYAAFTIPQHLSDFFIGGILFAAIIPVFQKRREEAGDEEASKDISALLNISFVVLFAITVIFYISVPWLTRLVFSGFKDEKLEMTIKFSRIFSPAILLFGFSLIYTSLYHAFRDFAVPSFSALIFPVSSLISIWLLPSSWGIERLIYGNLVGSFAGLLLLFFFIRKRISYKWNWDVKNPLIMATLLISWPVLLENIFLKIIPFIRNNIASELPFNGAITLIELTLFIIGSTVIFISGPISTAIFPFMGQQQAEKKNSELFSTFIKSVNIIFLFAAPLNVILLTQSDEIVKVLFGYGKFSDSDCLITSRLIMITSFIILPSCLQSVSGRMFFIIQQTKLVSFTSIGLILISWPLYFFLASLYGIYGLLSAATLIVIFAVTINLTILRFKFKENSFKPFYSSFLKITISGIVMATVITVLKLAFSNYLPFIILKFCLFSFAGVCSYGLFCYLLKLEEFKYFIDKLSFLRIKK